MENLGARSKLIHSAKLCSQFSSSTDLFYPPGKCLRQGNEVAVPISTKEDTEVVKAARAHTSSEQLLSADGKRLVENCALTFLSQRHQTELALFPQGKGVEEAWPLLAHTVVSVGLKQTLRSILSSSSTLVLSSSLKVSPNFVLETRRHTVLVTFLLL